MAITKTHRAVAEFQPRAVIAGLKIIDGIAAIRACFEDPSTANARTVLAALQLLYDTQNRYVDGLHSTDYFIIKNLIEQLKPMVAVTGREVADDASAVAARARINLALDAIVSAFFTIGGTGADVTLTAKVKAANDATMNAAFANGGATGLTPSATSTNTTAGVLPVAQVETGTVVGTVTDSGNAEVIVTANGMGNSPKTVQVAVLGGTRQVETATVLGTIGASGAGNASVIVTANGMTGSPKTIAVAVANNDTASQVAGKIRTALIADADVGDVTTGFFTVTGAGANIILTAKAPAANDGTLNVSVDNGTCTGLTAAPTSANTTAGVAPTDTASVVGGKIRAALLLDADVNAFFVVSGAGANIILTARTTAANDATMNISIDNGTCAGLTAAPTSANTTAGVAGVQQVETMTIVGTITSNGKIEITVTAAGMTGSPRTVLVDVQGSADDDIVVTDAMFAAAKASASPAEEVLRDAVIAVEVDYIPNYTGEKTSTAGRF